VADNSIGPGTVLAGRFRLEDLVQETAGAKFWRATDQTLARNVAVNIVDAGDRRAKALLQAARTSATVTDGHFLRVLDAAEEDGFVYVVNEWGTGISLDKMLDEGPLPPRRAAWLVKEVAEAITTAHRHGIAHGRLLPENVMVTEAGSVKLIGFVVDAVLNVRADREAGGEALGEHESDVVNLAALLYATLVGRWPGSAGSALPAAPREHDRALRPRQVRAGVPRPLDAICDRVLNAEAHQHAMPIETAYEVCAALSDFIGDPAGVRAGYDATSVLDLDQLATGTTDHESTRTDTGSTDGTATSGGTHAAGQDKAASTSAATSHGGAHRAPVSGAGPDPEATEAGAPLFFDDDTGVGWVSPTKSRGLRSDEDQGYRAAPPPPLPQPEPKPLFAPDPPGGRTRRDPSGPAPLPRRALGADQQTAGPPVERRAPGRSGPGTGSLPPVWGPDADQPDDPEDTGGWETRDAGKSWLQLAAIVAGCVLLVLAVIVAFNLGRGAEQPGTAADDPSAGQSGNQVARPVQIAEVDDFDPQGDSPQEENPDLVELAVDGDPSTAWQTLTYQGNPELGLLKDGVGLVVDLGRPVDVSRVDLTLVGQPTSLEILAADEGAGSPTTADGLTRVAAAEGAGPDVDLELDNPVTTRYLVVWLTSLPPFSDGYKGQVAEIVVRA
jgi:hypothetical protein